MNIVKRFLLMFTMLSILSLAACKVADDGSTDIILTAGEERTEITGSVLFDLRYVPAGSFVMGEDVQSPPPVVTLTKGYCMAETEVTYELWYEVYTWALSNGYTFAASLRGREGHDGTDGAVPTADKTEPVTMINWRDAMGLVQCLK